MKSDEEIEQLLEKQFPTDDSLIGRIVFWSVIAVVIFSAYTQLTDSPQLLDQAAPYIGIILGLAGLYWMFKDYQRGVTSYIFGRRSIRIERSKKPKAFLLTILMYTFIFAAMAAFGLYLALK